MGLACATRLISIGSLYVGLYFNPENPDLLAVDVDLELNP